MSSKAREMTTTSAYGWVVFLLFTVTFPLGGLLSFTFGVVLPGIRRDLDLSPVEAGLAAGIFFATLASLSIPFSGLFSRFGPRNLVLVSLALAAPFIFLQGMAQSFGVFLIARALFVVFQAVRLPAQVSIMQQWLAPRHYALANGISFALVSLVLTVSIISTAPLMEALGGWRNTYYFFGGLYLVGVLLWFIFGRERQGAEYAKRVAAQGGTPFRALVAYPQIWVVGVGMLAGGASWSAFFTFLPSFFVEKRDMSLALAGLVIGLAYFWSIPGSLLVGPLYARVKKRRPFIWIPGVYYLAMSLIVLLVPVKGVLVVLTGSLGLVWSMFPVVQTMPFELPGIKPREIAVLAGLMQTLTSVGFALGPIVTGALISLTGSLGTALLLVGITCPCIVIISALITSEARQERVEEEPGASQAKVQSS